MSVCQLNSLFSPQSSYLKCRTLPQPPTLLERVARGERRVDSTKLFTTEHNNSPYQATAFSFHLEILQLYLHFLWAMRNYIFILNVSEWYKFSKLMILDPSLLVCYTVTVNVFIFDSVRNKTCCRIQNSEVYNGQNCLVLSPFGMKIKTAISK